MNTIKMWDGSTEITIRERAANYFSGVVFVIAVILYGIPFALAWNWEALTRSFHSFLTHYWVLFLAITFGMILHEALHGFTWAWFCKQGRHSIRYGIKWQALAPYAQCDEVLPIMGYRLGCMMPGIVLGVIPALLGIFTGSGWLLVFGIFFTAGAAGDFLILWKLRPYNRSHEVLDHPSKIGCIVKRLL
jgi:hypothetical protein